MCVAAIEDGKESINMGLAFQVTDVKKPLVAVKRIAEKKNLVQFGDEPEDNFIQNKQTGDKVMLRKKGGSYVMDVQFQDGRDTEITVDSAAEESVCPKGWGQQFGIVPVQEGKRMNLVNASGGPINHYGKRDVVVQATLNQSF